MGVLHIYVLAVLAVTMMNVRIVYSMNVHKLRARGSCRLHMTTLEKPPVGKDSVKVAS